MTDGAPDILVIMRHVAETERKPGEPTFMKLMRDQFEESPKDFMKQLIAFERDFMIAKEKKLAQAKPEGPEVADEGLAKAVAHAERILAEIRKEIVR